MFFYKNLAKHSVNI